MVCWGENKMEGTKKEDGEEGEPKTETMYVEGSGLFELIKKNLTKLEALVVQGEMENGEYGESTHWYRKDEGRERYSVWQRLLTDDYVKNMDDLGDIPVIRKPPGDLAEETKKLREETKSFREETSETICALKFLNKVMVLGIGGLYAGALIAYLKYTGTSNLTIGIILISGAAIASFCLWLNCELER